MTIPTSAAGADRIDLLRTFVRIVESGSLSAAAVQLGTTQPTVSRRLQALERLFGLQLLKRSTHRMTLTDDGQRCFVHAQSLVADWEAIQADLRGEVDVPRGRLRVVVPHAFGQAQLLEPMLQFLARYPQVTLDWMLEDRHPDFIAEGIDCAIRVGYLQNSNLIAKRIGPIYGNLVASPDYIKTRGSPQTPDELVTHQALMQGMEAWHFMDGDKIVTVQPQGRFKADNATALAAAAAAGLGIAWLPDCITYDYVASGALVPIMTRYPPPSAGAYVIRPPGQHPVRKVRILTEMLIRSFALNPHLWGIGAEHNQREA